MLNIRKVEMSKDDLGDRMKSYELVETGRRFDPTLPIYARIDGRGFSRFTRRMERPFDRRMTRCMIETTKHLIDKTNAAIGYAQSDEISLVWEPVYGESDRFFSSKIQKMCSVLASMAAARFAVEYAGEFGEISRDFPHFDCRVISLPSKTEATNMLLWRELDARKNAVSMAARHFFSHRELQGKSSKEMTEMMLARGQSMDDYPTSFTRGTWIKRRTIMRFLTDEEMSVIPEKHRPSPDTMVERSFLDVIDMPPFNTVSNRENVIFGSEMPST